MGRRKRNIASYVSTARQPTVETLLAMFLPWRTSQMVEELEKEYTLLKDKVRELQEYL